MSTAGWFLMAALVLGGCGANEVDLEDELKGKEDYELVMLSQPKAPEKKVSAAPDTGLRATRPPDSLRAAPAAVPVAPAAAGEQAEAPIAFDPAGEFTVQIGSFDDARLAGERVKVLSAEGYPAYALANSGNKGARIRIGYFKTREEAERFGRVFKKDKGTEFWVDRRSNEKL